MRRTTEERRAIQQEALTRATTGNSMSNYPAIIEGFAAKGIPVEEINPRENVLTFNAWKAKGRHVKKGEHGVKVLTFVAANGKPEQTEDGKEESRTYRFPKSTTVFHYSQTEEDQN